MSAIAAEFNFNLDRDMVLDFAGAIAGAKHGHEQALNAQHWRQWKARAQGIAISFGSSPAPDDRFAASELASVLAQIIAGPSGNKAGNIVFYGTDGAELLPGPDGPSWGRFQGIVHGAYF